MSDRTPDRRSVLRTAAATAGVVLGGVGTASAYTAGDCVEVDYYSQVYEEPCPKYAIEPVRPGTQATVEETCFENGVQSVYLDFYDDSVPNGWMESGPLIRC